MVRRIGTTRFIVCAAPSYLAAHDEPRTPADLDHHDCVQRRRHESAGYAPWWFRRSVTGEPFEREVTGTLSFGRNDAIVDAGLAGAGLVQVHSYVAEPNILSGKLVQILANHAADGPPISVLFFSLQPAVDAQGSRVH